MYRRHSPEGGSRCATANTRTCLRLDVWLVDPARINKTCDEFQRRAVVHPSGQRNQTPNRPGVAARNRPNRRVKKVFFALSRKPLKVPDALAVEAGSEAEGASERKSALVQESHERAKLAVHGPRKGLGRVPQRNEERVVAPVQRRRKAKHLGFEDVKLVAACIRFFRMTSGCRVVARG